MQSLFERNRAKRIKELMSKKNNITSTKVVENKSQQIDRIVDYNQSLKQERKEHWNKLSQQYI